MSNRTGFWLAARQLSLAALLLGQLQSTAFATDCTYREDALGQTRYQCDNGKRGTLREDALGNVRGSNPKTGARITRHEDGLGNLRPADGTCRYGKVAIKNSSKPQKGA
ncbi:hypothetical protein [Aeromonas sp. QDB50]|uniref:hypothetical protein n=1 Tax=Aeromonas sp. QDB50 TaxID=2990493 RepID=UPI0022E07E38|nr:hypothetical protein [Aeromonas sp. QDB50]